MPTSAGGRILVMDDEEIVRYLTTAILSSLGYEVTTAIDSNNNMSDGVRSLILM